MTQPRESSIIKSVLAYLNSLPRCRAQKRHGARTRSGDPDITGCLQGHHLELEAKVPGNSPTPRQAAQLRKWDDAGAITGVVHSRKEARAVIEAAARARNIQL